MTEKEELACTDVTDSQHRLAFLDSVYHYLRGDYRVPVPSAVRMAALLLQGARGDWTPGRDSADALVAIVDSVLPPYALRDRPSTGSTALGTARDAVMAAIVAPMVEAAYRGLRGTAPLQAQRLFIQECKVRA